MQPILFAASPIQEVLSNETNETDAKDGAAHRHSVRPKYESGSYAVACR